jgi:hypothetical protein
VTYTTSTPDLSLPGIENTQSTSTGAMMEFLGPNIGSGLEFAHSGTSEQIPLYPNATGRQQQAQQQQSTEYTILNSNEATEEALHNWWNGNDHWADESTLLHDLDDLIAAYPSANGSENSAAFDEMRGTENEPPLFDLNAGMEPQQQTWTTDSFAPTATASAQDTTAQGVSADISMEDATFDDLNFDSVFDFDSMVDDGQGIAN